MQLRMLWELQDNSDILVILAPIFPVLSIFAVMINLPMKNLHFKLWQRILLSFSFLILLMLFAAPRIAEYYIEKHSKKLIGRELAVQKIRFNYLSGVLRIKHFTLYEQDTAIAFVSFDKLLVNLDYWPLIKKKLLVSEIKLENLFSQVIQEGKLFNFSDLTASPDSLANENEVKDTSSSSKITITINNITLVNSTLKYSDILLDHTIALDDINIFIPGFTLNSGSTNLDIDFDFVDGGVFYSSLAFNQMDNTYSINLQLDSLNMDIIEPYIKNSLDISELNGYFSNSINLSGNLQHIMQFHMNGWNQVDELDIFDQQNRNILSFEKFKITIDTFLFDKKTIRIGEISLIKPSILLELIDSSNNWTAMMIPKDSLVSESEPTDLDTSENKNTLNYSLQKIEFIEGEVRFVDKNLSSDFESLLHNINIKSKELGSLASEVDFSFTAELNKTATIISNIVLHPSNMEQMEIEFNLQKFPMTDIEPYMLHFFGYPVEEGLLNFSTKNELSTNTLNSNNKLFLRKFELGKPNKNDAEIKLPLRLALGILSDKDGVIDLSIPVENKDEKTNIKNIGKLIAKTIGNLFLKAATSPADLLSTLYKTSPEKLKQVKLGMFESIPNKDEMESLDIIAQILKDKPDLGVEFLYTSNKEIFYDSLSYQIVIESWKQKQKDQELISLTQVPDSVLKPFLTKELSSIDTNLRDLCIQYASAELLSTRYDSIKYQQVDFLNDYLLSHKEIPESKIKILYEAPDSLKLSNSHTVFYVNFKSAAALVGK